ncbi:MAG: DMT family transporter, partial [Candidatus Methanofastidiosa archaeon]|nr:DMT family transporter [Candidatus Methanofastidiosa archaeon]
VSLYLIITRRFRAKFSLIVYIFFVYSFSSIFLILFSILTRQKLFGYSRVTYVYLFLVALLPQIIGHTLYNWALKYFSAPFIAVSILGEPVFASLFAFMLLNERPSLLEIIGAIIIMVGIYLSQRAESLSIT